MNTGDVVVPLDQRVQSAVDVLSDQIKELQKACQHRFRMTKKIQWPETKVKGVFLKPQHSSDSLELKCLDCNESKETWTSEICIRCLGPMKKHGDDYREYREDSKKYVDGLQQSYVVRFDCSQCDFAYVT